MSVEKRVAELRDEALAAGIEPVPDSFQGVNKERIQAALAMLSSATVDMIDGVFALLDDRTENLFPGAPYGTKFSEGASTAHLGCHIGVLQRGASKLDREGRDYWIKPLRTIGAIEPVYLSPKDARFVPGHPKAKSPNSGYRLAESFKDILKASEGTWRAQLTQWASADQKRERLTFQARLETETANRIDNAHASLIAACVEHYVPRFLPGYEVLYVDDSDGDRISEEERTRLAEAGIVLTLDGGMPDVLLWNRDRNDLWVIEAVTSDGEVDAHKVSQLERLARESGKNGVGFTTAFETWRRLAARQAAHRNIAPGTYIWILEDPSKQFRSDA